MPCQRSAWYQCGIMVNAVRQEDDRASIERRGLDMPGDRLNHGHLLPLARVEGLDGSLQSGGIDTSICNTMAIHSALLIVRGSISNRTPNNYCECLRPVPDVGRGAIAPNLDTAYLSVILDLRSRPIAVKLTAFERTLARWHCGNRKIPRGSS